MERFEYQANTIGLILTWLYVGCYQCSRESVRPSLTRYCFTDLLLRVQPYTGHCTWIALPGRDPFCSTSGSWLLAASGMSYATVTRGKEDRTWGDSLRISLSVFRHSSLSGDHAIGESGIVFKDRVRILGSVGSNDHSPAILLEQVSAPSTIQNTIAYPYVIR